LDANTTAVMEMFGRNVNTRGRGREATKTSCEETKATASQRVDAWTTPVDAG